MAALPERRPLRGDFASVRQLGGNTIRVYDPSPLRLLDEAVAASQHGIFVNKSFALVKSQECPA